LPRLSLDDVRKRPKVIVGSSDVTALLAFLGAHTGLVTFHGPMVAQQIARGEYDKRSLTGLLASRDPFGKLEAGATETTRILCGSSRCVSLLRAENFA
jgi:muramoyltetrapeptide carboxypeptidase LdcA involved in peptidoglycan recycling